jgi:hypothetical protein
MATVVNPNTLGCLDIKNGLQTILGELDILMEMAEIGEAKDSVIRIVGFVEGEMLYLEKKAKEQKDFGGN